MLKRLSCTCRSPDLATRTMMFHCEVLKTKGNVSRRGRTVHQNDERGSTSLKDPRTLTETDYICSVLFSGIGFEERFAAGAGRSLLPQVAHADAAQVLLPHDPRRPPLQQGWPGLQSHIRVSRSSIPNAELSVIFLSATARNAGVRTSTADVQGQGLVPCGGVCSLYLGLICFCNFLLTVVFLRTTST